MAEFQQSINIMPATGLPGQVVQMFGYTPTPYNYVSDGTITAGTFAFLDPAEEANGGPMFAHSKVASGGRLIGFVQRIHSGLLNTPYVTNTEVYEKGQPITIAMRGQFRMRVPSGQTPTEGQSVLCDPTTGAITFGAAGAANDTGWIVHMPQGATSASEGALVIVEHLGLQVSGSGA